MLRAVSQSFPIPFGYTGQPQPYSLSQSSIPFIGLSTGSVSAAGAISGITALPVAYPRAYCWFPANILATVKAAGWYYCTFSTTTAGTAFLDTYTSGTPTIPSSPTPVTDGKGAFTGDTGEEFGPTITVPANALGANGRIRTQINASANGGAGTKLYRIRYSASGGTIVYSGDANTGGLGVINSIANRGVTNAQVASNIQALVVDSIVTAYPAVDTTANTSVVISFQRNTATTNTVLESYLIELLYSA